MKCDVTWAIIKMPVIVAVPDTRMNRVRHDETKGDEGGIGTHK